MPFHVSLEFSSIQVCQSLGGKESACQCRRLGFSPCVKKIPWRRKWQSTPVFLPGKSHGQWSLVGCSPWGRKRGRHDVATKQQQMSVTLKNKSVKQETWAGCQPPSLALSGLSEILQIQQELPLKQDPYSTVCSLEDSGWGYSIKR